jgi:hypothetical protein
VDNTAQDTTSPYSTVWNTATVTITHADRTGRAMPGNTTTKTVSVTVANPDTTAPAVA